MHVEFCGVKSCIARWHKMWDDVKILWCHSHLVLAGFEGSIPTCACFRS